MKSSGSESIDMTSALAIAQMIVACTADSGDKFIIKPIVLQMRDHTFLLESQ